MFVCCILYFFIVLLLTLILKLRNFSYSVVTHRVLVFLDKLSRSARDIFNLAPVGVEDEKNRAIASLSMTGIATFEGAPSSASERSLSSARRSSGEKDRLGVDTAESDSN